MPPAGMSIGCTWRVTICSIAASLAEPAPAAGMMAASMATIVVAPSTGAAIH